MGIDKEKGVKIICIYFIIQFWFWKYKMCFIDLKNKIK